MPAPTRPSGATLQLIQRALACAQAGDAAGTRAAAETGLRGSEALEIFHAMLGRLDCQAGEFASGIGHFRSALAATPGDIAVRTQLVRALIESGDTTSALESCPEDLCRADSSLRLMRLRAYLLQQTEAYAAAAAAYRIVVTADADDFESWNNLGNALSATGQVEDGLAAIERAVQLQPGNAPARFNRATTLIQLGRFDEAESQLLSYSRDLPDEARSRVQLAALCKLRGRDSEALGWLEEAARLAPRDAELRIKLGLERQFAWQMESAEEAFRAATALEPQSGDAHIVLALHLEHMNKLDALAAVRQTAAAAGAPEGAVHFLQALLHRRAEQLDDALAELDGVPADLQPIRVAQMRGQCHDRLGHADEAFGWFSEMNRLQQADPSEPVRRAGEYRDALARDRALLTPEWYGEWRREPIGPGRPSPVFLLGFPRSGTTLLDTMLMGHPQVQVLEERPAITRVEREIGGVQALADLSGTDITRLRDTYFDEVRRWIPLRANTLLVDKSPLHLNKVPIIHRLFPDARFILALRHPLDVLLSCYITNFRLNNAMANFLDLETAAWVYDQSFGFWEQSRQILGIESHTVIYERVVGSSEDELRSLCAWLGLDWHEDVLDHQRTAVSRGMITTASYAQVIEPLYTRARGRWERYRQWLEPVLPVMRPWIERHGYQV
jgi:tetratricopeptide (TPR) repeat protein